MKVLFPMPITPITAMYVAVGSSVWPSLEQGLETIVDILDLSCQEKGQRQFVEQRQNECCIKETCSSWMPSKVVGLK
jgi:hypothetical protein